MAFIGDASTTVSPPLPPKQNASTNLLMASTFLHSPYFNNTNEDINNTTIGISTEFNTSIHRNTSNTINDIHQSIGSYNIQNTQIAEALVTEKPYDTAAWDALLHSDNVTVNSYERVLEYFPTSPRYWRLYAEFETQHKRYDKALSIYKRCIHSCGELELWKSYIKFLYQTGTASDVIQALETAVEKVGMDHRSGILWKEFLILLMKMYNTGLLKQGVTQGLLNNPQRSDVRGAFSGVPLVPTAFEEECFMRTIPDSSQTFVEKYAEIATMRRYFQEWLSTATEFTDVAWEAYCDFERSTGSSSVLTARFIAEYEPRCGYAKEAYNNLLVLFEKIDVTESAVPITVHNASAIKPNAIRWKQILAYEASNPLHLSVMGLQRRMRFYYQLCLLSCSYHPDIWCSYFQFLLSHKQIVKALDTLHLAIERFLPDDELLKFILCHYLEEVHQIEAAREVYTSMIGFKPATSSLTDDNSNKLNAFCGAGSPLALINYLGFIRRNDGITAWHKAFDELCCLPCCTWEVYVHQALCEWRCTLSLSVALQILKLGMIHFKLEPKYILAYVDFLLDTGNMQSARDVLSRGISDIQNEASICSEILWEKWIRLEHQFGDKQSLRFVQDLNSKQQHGMNISEALLQSGDNYEDIALSISDALQLGPIKPISNTSYTTAEAAALTNTFDAKFVDKNSILFAKIETKRWQFGGGDTAVQLYERFSFAKLYPRTSMLETYLKGEVERVKPPLTEEMYAEEERIADSNTSSNQLRYNEDMLITRPDVTRMMSFKPVVGAVLSKLNSSEMDSGQSKLLIPSKAICDFIHILPKSKDNVGIPPHLIDYLAASLQCITIPPIELNEFTPIPVKQLLALREMENQSLSMKRLSEKQSNRGRLRRRRRQTLSHDAAVDINDDGVDTSAVVRKRAGSQTGLMNQRHSKMNASHSTFFRHSERSLINNALSFSSNVK